MDDRVDLAGIAGSLGTSREQVLKLVDSGELVADVVGGQLLVRLEDLAGYQRRLAVTRREALQEMADIARESGLYEATAGGAAGIR